jgi:peptidoglycan/xylan/chitin deacetylase (PgdA/CDA1 family)
VLPPDDPRPVASLSLDLDNLWLYLRFRGIAGWRTRPSYYDTFVPYIIDLLAAHDLRATFFIVGADAADPRNGVALRRLVRAGHELANHSLEHEPWLHRYSRLKLEHEVRDASWAIADASGQTVDGFRGPGFSWCPALLEVLVEQGYRYDASTLPTYLGPLTRACYFRAAGLSREQREDHKEMFGQFSDGLRPAKPYRWRLADGRSLIEIPVTTMPVFKTPFHFSYLAGLARFSEALMIAYLDTALGMCRLTRTAPSFLLHPLDAIGGDQVPQLACFPGMGRPSADKKRLLGRVLDRLQHHYRLVTMGEHASRIAARALPLRRP